MCEWLIDVLASDSMLGHALMMILVILSFGVAVGVALFILWLNKKWVEFECRDYYEPPRVMSLADRISIEADSGRAVPDTLFKLYNTPEVLHLRSLCLPSNIQYRIERFLSPKHFSVVTDPKHCPRGIPYLVFAESRFIGAFVDPVYIELPTRREEDVPLYSPFELPGVWDTLIAPSLEELYVLWCQVARHPGVISNTEIEEIEALCDGTLPRTFLEIYSHRNRLLDGEVVVESNFVYDGKVVTERHTYRFYLPPEIVSVKRQTWARSHPRNRLFFAYDVMGDSVLFIDLPKDSRTDLLVYLLQILEDGCDYRIEATCTLADLVQRLQLKGA